MPIARLKPAVFALCLLPAGLLIWRAFFGDLGPNPVETITHTTGDWALRLLLLTLTITPARRLLRMPELIRWRRMLGLFAFFYVVLHFLTWLVLDKSLSLSAMTADIIKRPFITAGSVGLACMIPLALTSTAGWIRRLGGKRWQKLHRLIYVCAAAGVLHYYWLVKSDVRLPLLYGSIFALLMVARLKFLRAAAPAGGSSSKPRTAGVR